jgi:hypothetical protein
MKRIIFLPFFLLAACGIRDTKDVRVKTPVVESKPVVEAAKAPDRCELVKAGVNELDVKSVMPPQMITVERHFQRIVRKNCAGQVTSDQVETVKSPHYNLSLQASSDRKYKSVFILNKTSCDHVLTTMPVSNPLILGNLSSVTGDDQGHIKIKADLVNALLTFNINEGWNDLYVQYFYDCSPKNVAGGSKVIKGEGTCEASADSRLEKYPVHVKYVEKNLDGVIEIKPPTSECQVGT